MKKILPIAVVAIVLIGSGAFYGGMKYAESKNPTSPGRGNFQDFQNLSDTERQQRIQEMGASTGGAPRARGGINGEFANGEIISKDDTSITIKLPNGGSKIVFYSSSTEVNKYASGTPSDLILNKFVTVNGSTNQDGSLTAQSIQIRPNTSPNPTPTP